MFSLISHLPDKETKLQVLLLFLEEIGGMIHHLESVGGSWGAAGEENRAWVEKNKYKQITQKIKDTIIELA